MTDLPAMDPCPVSKGGRHSLASIVPTEDADMDVTLYCERCGAVRRFCVSGDLLASRLDDADAESILLASLPRVPR